MRSALDPPAWQDVTLRLVGAVPSKDEGIGDDLRIFLATRGEKWRPYAMGFCTFYEAGKPTHRGLIMDAEGTLEAVRVDGNATRLEVAMVLNDDPWVTGGTAEYTLDLRREGNQLTGSYRGVFHRKGGKHMGPKDDIQVEGRVTGRVDANPWPGKVDGHKPLKRGEHPRLIFRKHDLKALRKRAETEEGKAILKRLRLVLGGGEDMPTRYNRAKRAYGGGSKVPRGGYTLWHGMGFGMLYQLTGEPKYADLARRCVEKARKGQRDRDQRYSYVRPGGKLRAGSSYAAIAMAYDLCYDAWDADYRKQLAREIQNKVFNTRARRGSKALAEPVAAGLVFNTLGGQHHVYSNHYGAWNGGGGTAILAILGDPGTDDDVTPRAHRVFLRRAKRALQVGYGDRAYFFEGHHCGRLSSNTGLVSYLQALKVALGLDYVENYQPAEWLLTKWLYELHRQNGRLVNNQRGMYASGGFARGGMSTGGDFSQGFGIVTPEHKPAVKWFFNHVVEPGDGSTYDAINYPHRAVYAFVNWPVDVEEKNPAEVLPPIIYDSKAGQYNFRSRWKNEADVVISCRHTAGKIYCLGMSPKLPTPRAGEVTHARWGDGTAVASMRYSHWGIEGTSCLAADHSGLSGADVLLVTLQAEKPVDDPNGRNVDDDFQRKALQKLLNKAKAKPRDEGKPVIRQFELDKGRQGTARLAEVTSGPLKINLLTVMRKGEHPAISAAGEGNEVVITIGKRTIRYQDGRIVLGRKGGSSSGKSATKSG